MDESDDDLEIGDGRRVGGKRAIVELVPHRVRACGAIGPFVNLGSFWYGLPGSYDKDGLLDSMEINEGKSMNCARACGLLGMTMGWVLIFAPIPTMLNDAPVVGCFAKFGLFFMSAMTGIVLSVVVVLLPHLAHRPVRAISYYVALMFGLFVLNATI